MTTHTIESLTELYNTGNTTPSPARIARLAKALELGATDSVLEEICNAARTSERATILLPRNRLENLSRGRGWCRKGKGDKAEWGEREDDGYRVGPGRWTVGGNDGFSRKNEDSWLVKNVQVGDQIWTIAN